LEMKERKTAMSASEHQRNTDELWEIVTGLRSDVAIVKKGGSGLQNPLA